MTIPHPIPYQGSKRRLAGELLAYLPQDTRRLVEPFAGSGALSLAAAASNRATGYHLNDINAPLMGLWAAILTQPERLADRYDWLWHRQLGDRRRYYDLVRDRFNRTHRPYYLLYLLARCVKASVRYNANGAFNQSPDNRRKGKQPDKMRREITGAAALLGGKTTLAAVDYREVIQAVQPDDVVYLDPPYQGVSTNRDPRYLQSVTFADFVEALHDLNRRGIAYLVSYDGRTENKTFGQPLPDTLDLTHKELNAGRSSQATLLGRRATTYEALYLSPALVERLGTPTTPPIQQELKLIYG